MIGDSYSVESPEQSLSPKVAIVSSDQLTLQPIKQISLKQEEEQKPNPISVRIDRRTIPMSSVVQTRRHSTYTGRPLEFSNKRPTLLPPQVQKLIGRFKQQRLSNLQQRCENSLFNTSVASQRQTPRIEQSRTMTFSSIEKD